MPSGGEAQLPSEGERIAERRWTRAPLSVGEAAHAQVCRL